MGTELKPVNQDDRKWGAIAHFSALIGLLLPLGLVLGPLLVWALKKNDSAFIEQQAKAALNFQLTILIATFALALLSSLIRPLLPLAFVIGLAGLIFAAMAGFNVLKGRDSSYPWSLRLIR